MNPYVVLNIDSRATKQEIIRAAARALRERKYSGREIAEAQRELLDPVTKGVHDFLQFLGAGSVLSRPILPERTPGLDAAGIERLSIFDDEHP